MALTFRRARDSHIVGKQSSDRNVRQIASPCFIPSLLSGEKTMRLWGAIPALTLAVGAIAVAPVAKAENLVDKIVDQFKHDKGDDFKHHDHGHGHRDHDSLL